MKRGFDIIISVYGDHIKFGNFINFHLKIFLHASQNIGFERIQHTTLSGKSTTKVRTQYPNNYYISVPESEVRI